MAKIIRKRPKADEANPAFIMIRLVMLDSVAYWALKPIEARLLNVIEIEHLRHGGNENGKLTVTRRQFERRGIPRMAIAPGLRALAALGFIELTQRGAAGIGDQARAHRFRLTYVQPNPTDEWRKHCDPVRAIAEVKAARADTNIRARRLGLHGPQKQNAGPKTETGLVLKLGPGPPPGRAKNAPNGPKTETGPGPKSGPSSISRMGRAMPEQPKASPDGLFAATDGRAQ
jgi:hypothetical protein